MIMALAFYPFFPQLKVFAKTDDKNKVKINKKTVTME